MKITWVLVADEAIARVLERPPTPGPLRPVHALTDPAAHQREAGALRDAHGRRAAGGAHGASDTVSAADSQRHQIAAAFARRVALWLQEAVQGGRFDELQIAAAPRFLGLLRAALAPQTQARVVRELDRDWVHDDEATLARRFFD